MAKAQVSKLRFEDLYKRIEKGDLDSVYFLNGVEEYLKIEFLRLMRKKLFGDSQASANVEKVSAVAGSAARIIDLASDYSLFSGGRLVVVYDAQRISKNGQEMLVSFFSNIPPGNHMVVFGPESFDMRRKFFKYLTAKATWSTLRGLSESSAPFWIKKRLGAFGIRITKEALDRLLRYVGNSYGLLANQIDKLAIAVGDKEQLDVDDVERHTAVAAECEVFKLLDMIEKGDRQRSLEVLQKLLDKSSGMGSVLFMLSRHFTQYYYLATTRNAGSGSEAARQLAIPTYRIGGLTEAARRKPARYYEKAIKAITQAEVSLRFDRIPQKLVLENLVINLTDGN
jgi:DNA polymerase-3 subunit delta